jgi:hypothetical protein
LSILCALFVAAAQSHAATVPENNLSATQLKRGVDKFAVRSTNVSVQAFSQELSSNTFLSASTLALSPTLHISFGQEQRVLVLLGFACLLGGLFWLKKARRVEDRPAVSYRPVELSVVPPKMEPEWIEVDLVTEPAPQKARNEAQVSV